MRAAYSLSSSEVSRPERLRLGRLYSATLATAAEGLRPAQRRQGRYEVYCPVPFSRRDLEESQGSGRIPERS